LASRRVCKYTLDTGPGSQTILVNLDVDMARGFAILGELLVTKSVTDAIDTLDVRLQSCNSADAANPVWNTRARFAQILGNMTTSASAPEIRDIALQKFGTLSDGEEAYEPSGSAGGSDLAAGSVLNGPFPGPRRTSAGRQPSWRLKIDVVDADADADFEGAITLWLDTADE
jgi:hypothetical protein